MTAVCFRARRSVLLVAALAALPLLGAAGPAAAHERHEVADGDTLSGIASLYGVGIATLAAENGVANHDLVVSGTTLVIPEGGGSGGGGGGSRTHTVAPGETLSSIAARYGVRVPDLAEANGLANPHLVRSGARLRLPGGGSASAGDSGSGGGGGSGSGSGGGGGGGRGGVGTLIASTAARYGWNPATIQALAMVESGWNNAVVSSAGAVGIMQVLPATADWVGPGLLGRRVDLHDPADNVETGVALLDHLYGRTGRDLRLTLGAYYQGLGAVERHGLYDETERYVDTVLALRERY